MNRLDSLFSACGAVILYVLINDFIYRMNGNWIIGVIVYLITYVVLRVILTYGKQLVAKKAKK